ncbi:MAG TPA: CAP domain-containing protein [Acidimicrobiales bacterium]|nr:CAP domain-containing protein [Acidimicrobiales bacterium]
MRRFGRVLMMLTATVLSTALLAGAASAEGETPTVADRGAMESEFSSLINQLRASKGLAPLRVDLRLVDTARSWSGTMAGQARIWHNPNFPAQAPATWERLGENVGVGPDGAVGGIHDAFVASPTHYANLVDGQFTMVGIGIQQAGDQMFVTEHFMNEKVVAPKATRKSRFKVRRYGRVRRR